MTAPAAQAPSCPPAAAYDKIARVRAHLWAGVVAGAISGTLGSGIYWLKFSHRWPGSFAVFAAAVVGYLLVCGLAVGGAQALAAGRSSKTPALLLYAAAFGIVPGFIGVLGFGSLHAAYMGNELILVTCLVGGLTYVVGAAQTPTARGRMLAAASALVVAGALAGLGWMFVTTLDVVPSFPTLRAAVRSAPVLTAAAVGAGLGVFVAIVIVLARHVERSLGLLLPAEP